MHYLRRRFHIFSVDVMAGADIRILGSITGEWERHAGNRLQDYGGSAWRLLRAVCWGKGCFSGILMLVWGDR